MALIDPGVLLRLLVAIPVALGGVALLTPLVIQLAHWRDWLAHPRDDRWHAEPTALMGGLAIYAGASLGMSVVATLVDLPLFVLSMVWGGASILFLVGVIDDRYGLQPGAKLAAQVVATGLLLYSGIAFGQEWPLWVSLPLTLLWVVGITNAVNLLDNMDGLSAGVAGIAALILVACAALTSNLLALGLGASIVGASAGFLMYNFKPARIFMGDCGSLFLGFTVAALSLLVQQSAPVGDEIAVAIIPLAILAVPIFDTTLVTFMRKLSGRPVSQGGRDHASHRLVFLGLSERNAVLGLYGISLLSGAFALFVLFMDATLVYALSALVTVAFAVFGIHLARADVYDGPSINGDGAPSERPNALQKPTSTLYALFGHRWKAFLGVAADTLLVAASFVLAHHVRFETGIAPAHEDQLLQALPLVVAAKISLFFVSGLYRGIWRHAGTAELVRTFGATLAGSLATVAIVGGLYGLSSLSGAVVIIDWMITLIFVVGVRFGFRGLRQLLSMQRTHDTRVLLYGAGDAGTLALRELRQNPDRKLQPVGFIDDDPLKQNHRVQGLRVLGDGSDLGRLCRRHQIDTVIVTTTKMSTQRERDIWKRCQQLGILCRRLDLSFQPIAAPTAASGRSAGAFVKSS